MTKYYSAQKVSVVIFPVLRYRLYPIYKTTFEVIVLGFT